jgi:dUTP pyrophosphatase
MDAKTAEGTMEPIILFKKIQPDAHVPRYMTQGSAGLDLCALDDIEIPAGFRTLVRTGLAIEIPPGFEGQIRSRSGMVLKHGICVANAPGTIDSDYRGEIKVILENTSHDRAPFLVEPGMRIAQLVICPVARATVQMTEALTKTGRGSGGFGHTGT